MAYTGYMRFGDVELANLARLKAYAGSLNLPQVVLPQNYDWIREAAGDPEYSTPAVDIAPWYDADIAASADFGGVMILTAEGIDSSTRESTVSEYTVDGGNGGRLRNGTKTIVFTANLSGRTEAACEYGLRWLKRMLRQRDCVGTSQFCYGQDMDYFRYRYQGSGEASIVPDYDTEILGDGATMYYPGGWGGSSLDDAGAFGRDIDTLVGTAPVADGGYAETQIDVATQWGGTAGHIRTSYTGTPTSGSYEFWLYFSEPPAADLTLVGWSPNSGTEGTTSMVILKTDGKLTNYSYSGAGVNQTSTDALTEDTWYHVKATCATGGMKLRINAANAAPPEASASFTAPAPASLRLHGNYNGVTNVQNVGTVRIAKVAWYEGVQLSDEISDYHYEIGLMDPSGFNPVTFSEAASVHLRNVTVNRGPLVTRKRTRACDSLWQVTWTAVAGDPYEYGLPAEILDGLGVEADPYVNPYSGTDGYTTFTEEACPVPVWQPIYDPLYPAAVAPPAPPDFFPDGWYISPGTWERFYAEVPDSTVPLWDAVVPIITLHSPNGDARMIRVRIYEEGFDPDDVCTPLWEAIISYLPEDYSFVIDGVQQVAYVWDGVSANVRRADSLVFGTNATPMLWPAFSCGDGLLITLEQAVGSDEMADISLDLSLVPKGE